MQGDDVLPDYGTNERASVEFKQPYVIVVPGKDNVAISRADLPLGCEFVIGKNRIVLDDAIGRGQRFALTEILSGEVVIQYGVPFGTSKGIRKGGLIQSKNVAEIPFQWTESVQPCPPDLKTRSLRTFLGFKRVDGRVGTRNHYLIVPTSQCASQVALQVVEQAKVLDVKTRFPNVDSIVAIPNTEGCGCAANVQIERFLRVLNNYINHTNVGGVLVVDLGCEQTNYSVMEAYLERHGKIPTIPMDWLTIQKTGGVGPTLERAQNIVQKRIEEINRYSRSECSARHLLIGTECGASDSFSGITANPTIGNAVDKIIAEGGGALLSEVPEMIGAERTLMLRMRNAQVISDFRKMMNWYLELADKLGVNMGDNLVPENQAGGLINACIKSLGAIAKGGTTAIEGIVGYGELVEKSGLHLAQGPGNDMESVTGLVASGANIVCFSTGKGTITGNAIVPVIKVSSTSQLYQAMPDIIDYDAGVWLEDASRNMDRMGDGLFQQILAVASGKKTRSEENGQHQFQVWTAGKLSL